jgi:hypothetical protein
VRVAGPDQVLAGGALAAVEPHHHPREDLPASQQHRERSGEVLAVARPAIEEEVGERVLHPARSSSVYA